MGNHRVSSELWKFVDFTSQIVEERYFDMYLPENVRNPCTL